MDEQVTNRAATLNHSQDLNNHLYCPHDLSVNTEFRDDLPTLLGENPNQFESKDDFDRPNVQLKIKRPTITVFLLPKNHGQSNKNTKKSPQINEVKFVSPYSRYLAVLPFAEQQRMEELSKEADQNRKRKLCPEKHVTIATDVIMVSNLICFYFDVLTNNSILILNRLRKKKMKIRITLKCH